MKKAIIRLFLFLFIVLFFVYAIWKLFPIKYKKEIVNISSKYNLDPVLVCSVISAESGFDANAISVANAKGLMQINPITAEEISSKLNTSKYDLYDPIVNIEFGCYYLRYLLDLFNDEKMALCAYNAGPNKVKNWEINNIEDIPIEETRNYVKKIEKNKKVYNFFYF